MGKLFKQPVNELREFTVRDVKQPKIAYRDLVVHFAEFSDMKKFQDVLGVTFDNTDTELWYSANLKKQKKLFSVTPVQLTKVAIPHEIYPDYRGMPEYISNDKFGFHQIIIHFEDKSALEAFLSALDIKITDKTKYIWYPPQTRANQLEYVYKSDIQNQFPIYVISKGRWQTPYTVKNLKWMGITNYYVIVEEQEYENYKASIGPEHLLILDKEYQKNYETVDPEGDAMGLPVGSGAARNFGWEHSIKLGYTHHWMVDDNIFGFYRLNNNKVYRVQAGAFFRAMEDFVLRYDNIAMAGPQYCMFIPYKSKRHPLEWNTRCYSCNLIRNDIPFRWRCRYNEDTDLSLRILKAGYSTVLFVGFLQDKAVTQSVKGGNTNTIYQVGTGVKSKALARLHPDVTEVVYKYGRIHHYVNYNSFKLNNPKLKENVVIPAEGENEYNMTLVYTGDTKNQCRL